MPTSSESAARTEALAAQLAASLQPGDVVLVSGDLGAGKTTFVRGACRALGVQGPVTSPTFTLARRYEGTAAAISHLDLHRLAGSLEHEDPALLAGELAEERIVFVEWPEVGPLEGLHPARVAARVALEHAGGDHRRVTIARRGDPGVP
jgi:tRNA threonylcarbamoyladenosine biosynthesis protein TsaE